MSEEDFRSPYPGYDVLEKWRTPSWNDQTRRVVARRLNAVPQRRFLTAEQWETLEAACARLIPQPDRAEPVPVAPWIDRKLAENDGPGYRYEGMPPMREAWRRGLDALEAEARAQFGGGFADLAPQYQDEVLRAIQSGEVKAEAWRELPAKRFFTDLLLKEVAAVYYAHPAAWSEIGFGGPASPRGYVRMGFDRRDGWEAELDDG